MLDTAGGYNILCNFLCICLSMHMRLFLLTQWFVKMTEVSKLVIQGMHFMPSDNIWMTQRRSWPVGITVWSILALGFMSHATETTMSSECEYIRGYGFILLLSSWYEIEDLLASENWSRELPLILACRDLGNSSLSGSLVPELGNLASLEYL